MREAVCLLLLIAGLSGCVSRNPGSREMFYTYRDSVSRTQLDTSCLHYNRHTLLQGKTRLKEISLSSPDSTGNQHVERIVYAAEEWNVTDSAEVSSTSVVVANNQIVTAVGLTEKEVVKQKPHRIAGYVLVLFFIIIIICIFRKILLTR